jgi:hypothetical protein
MKFDLSTHVRAINALVTKLDNALDKADQYQRSIGQHIASIKTEHPKDWESIVKEQCKLGRSRAYEMLAIADGTKTAVQLRTANTERRRKNRKHESETSRTPKHDAIAELIKANPQKSDDEIAHELYIPDKRVVGRVREKITKHSPEVQDAIDTINATVPKLEAEEREQAALKAEIAKHKRTATQRVWRVGDRPAKYTSRQGWMVDNRPATPDEIRALECDELPIVGDPDAQRAADKAECRRLDAAVKAAKQERDAFVAKLAIDGRRSAYVLCPLTGQPFGPSPPEKTEELCKAAEDFAREIEATFIDCPEEITDDVITRCRDVADVWNIMANDFEKKQTAQGNGVDADASAQERKAAMAATEENTDA